MRRDLLLFAGIMAAFVGGGAILMMSHVLPEEKAMDFNALSEVSFNSDLRVIKNATADDGTYIYAINEVAEQAFYIAREDPRVKEIIDGARDKSVTIAAVQPTVLESPDGKLLHSSSGQVMITANWQAVGGAASSGRGSNFDDLEGMHGESRQQIWNVMVDLDRRRVTDILQEQERVMSETLQRNVVFAGMNMFMPEAASVAAGSSVSWYNDSNVPHNVVGIYKKKPGDVAGDVPVDSGFIEHERSWKYTFTDEGVFEYRCTIHSEEGMKGAIFVVAAAAAGDSAAG